MTDTKSDLGQLPLCVQEKIARTLKDGHVNLIRSIAYNLWNDQLLKLRPGDQVYSEISEDVFKLKKIKDISWGRPENEESALALVLYEGDKHKDVRPVYSLKEDEDENLVELPVLESAEKTQVLIRLLLEGKPVMFF